MATAHQVFHRSVWQQHAANYRHAAGYHNSAKPLSALKMAKTESSRKCAICTRLYGDTSHKAANLTSRIYPQILRIVFVFEIVQIWRQCERKINIRHKLFRRNTRAKCLRFRASLIYNSRSSISPDRSICNTQQAAVTT